jgi:predicted aspartyl protease
MISSMGLYNREEKIILKVTIRGHDNNEHYTTAMVDCGATENFIDERYAKQNNIPLRRKAIPRRVLAVDRQEVANGPVTHDALVDLTINNHYETIKLHCITIGNSPNILGLPWLRKHHPNIDWKEGHVIFDSARCAKECLVTSPHAITVAEEKAIGEYYRDTTQDTAFHHTVCSTSMLEEEEDEEREEMGIEEAIIQGYIEETLTMWELYHVGLETTQR